MPDFGIFRGFNEKLFGDKLVAGQLPTQLGLIGSESFGFTGLLDDYPNAAAAYSLRQLRNAYTGDAIEVRRASDNSTQNIGFVNNELDTTSLESFCSGTNGFVTTWYDQSGNGNDASQTTAANQPQIVSSGSTITEDGKPSLQFDGSDDDLSVSTPILDAGGEQSIFSTINNTSGSWFSQYTSSTTGRFLLGLRGTGYNGAFFGGGTSFGLNISVPNANNELITVIKDSSSSMDGYLNGSLIESASGTSKSIQQINSQVGSLNGLDYLDAKFQEIILYNSDQSSNRTDIETNINDFYNIY